MLWIWTHNMWKILFRIISSLWISINSKLLYKMIIIYSLLTVIPLVLVSTTFYLKSKSAIENKLIESRTQALVETSDKIDGILKVYADKINDIGESRTLKSLLHNDKDPFKHPLEESDRKSVESTLNAIINNEIVISRSTVNYVEAVYIRNLKGKIYSTQDAQPIQFSLAIEFMPFQIKDIPEWAFFIDHKRLVCSKRVTDNTNGELLGHAVLVLKQGQMASLYSSYPRNSFLITNRSGVILSSDQPEQIGELLDLGLNKNILVNRRFSDNRNLVYQNLVSKPTLYKEINDLGYFAGAITLITGLGRLLFTFLYPRVTKPESLVSLTSI